MNQELGENQSTAFGGFTPPMNIHLEIHLSPQVRIIPLQLQRLFAQLLLLDQEAASTIDLTDSFGWSSDEVGRCQQGGFLFCLMSFKFVSDSSCWNVFMHE